MICVIDWLNKPKAVKDSKLSQSEILTFLIHFSFNFLFTAFAMTPSDRTALRDFAKLIAAGIKHCFSIKRVLAFTFSIACVAGVNRERANLSARARAHAWSRALIPFPFPFGIESIIWFISFSKCPWELSKAVSYYLQPENLIYFDQIETKLTSEMEKQKSFIFAVLGQLKRSGVVCQFFYDDICLTEECREKTPGADHTWQNPPRLN